MKTRKEHKCWGCSTTFKTGVNLRRVVNVDNGKAFATYWCQPCDKTWMSHSDESDDSILFGEVRKLDGWEDNKQKFNRTFETRGIS